MNVSRTAKMIAAIYLSSLLCSEISGAETVVVRSGQVNNAPGVPGEVDTSITYFENTVGAAPLSAQAFNPGDFAAARNGPNANIPGLRQEWTSSLPSDQDARWIDGRVVDGGPPPFPDPYPSPRSILYAVPFTIQSTTLPPYAWLDLHWATDDRLGDPSNGPNPIGVYVNEVPLSSAFSGGDFDAQYSASSGNIISLITGGQNYLYVYSRDTKMVAGGAIFSATVTLSEVPEPSALAIAFTAMFGFLTLRRVKGDT